jgi:hypothetical protein
MRNYQGAARWFASQSGALMDRSIEEQLIEAVAAQPERRFRQPAMFFRFAEIE